MTDLYTRRLTSADEQLLMNATLGNVNWAEQRFTMRDIVDRQEFARYARLDPMRGDFGFVAERKDRTIGVIWALFLPPEDAGYGFVDIQTPELALWVDAEERGRGLGRHLLRLMKAEAGRGGIRTMSLSVETGNIARRLYETEGFRYVPGRVRDGVMIWTSRDD